MAFNGVETVLVGQQAVVVNRATIELSEKRFEPLRVLVKNTQTLILYGHSLEFPNGYLKEVFGK